MKMSNMFVQTMREFPSDAEVVSHKMLARAGYIKKLTSGVYTFLPLMWRVLKKVENIIRDEMDKAGAHAKCVSSCCLQISFTWREPS